MYGNFSRVTYDRRRHVSRVLAEQGTVTVDAEDNECAAVGLDALRVLALDLIGPHGTVAPAYAGQTPVRPDSFRITGTQSLNFGITPGRYWVAGRPCELERPEDRWVPPGLDPVEDGPPVTGPSPSDPVTYLHQPDYPNPPALQNGERYLVYLDVWERHVSSVTQPDLREQALGGADSASRAQLVWQVKVLRLAANDFDPSGKLNVRPEELLRARLLPRSDARLAARALQEEEEEEEEDGEECEFPPEPRFRGPENQLYRVEIHRPGTGGNATFKWSRDNGSVVFPILAPVANPVRVESLGRDDRLTVERDDFVEAVDLDIINERVVRPLGKVLEVDPDEGTVTLPDGFVPGVSETRFPLLRRWHHDVEGLELEDGAIKLREGDWLDLEDGVQVWFQAGGTYNSGDYWLIPARTETGDVLWPRGRPSAPGGAPPPLPRPPEGVLHHYAPLRLVSVGADGTITLRKVFRRTIQQASK